MIENLYGMDRCLYKASSYLLLRSEKIECLPDDTSTHKVNKTEDLLAQRVELQPLKGRRYLQPIGIQRPFNLVQVRNILDPVPLRAQYIEHQIRPIKIVDLTADAHITQFYSFERFGILAEPVVD